MVEDASYTENGSVIATIDGVEYTIPDDPGNRYRQMVAAWEADGNTIVPYDASLLPLTPLQFWLAAATVGVTEDAVRDAIGQLPEPDRTTGLIEMRHAKTFKYNHPLITQIAAAFDIDEEELETLKRLLFKFLSE